MENKLKLIPSIYLYRGEIIDIKALEKEASEAIESGTGNRGGFTQENNAEELTSYCAMLCHGGADELLIFDLSEDDEGHEANLSKIRDIAEVVDIPMIAGGNVKRLEDVKKYIYAGASRAFLNMGVSANAAMIGEASARFGRERVAVYTARMPKPEETRSWSEQGAGLLIIEDTSCGGRKPQENDAAVMNLLHTADLPVIWMSKATPEAFVKNYREVLFAQKSGVSEAGQADWDGQREAAAFYGVSLDVFQNAATPLMQYKRQFADAGLNVFLLDTPRPFSEFRTNSDGLIPVVVQDYQTNEVLMLAYMNEEAFNHTLACGRMTYYSRSRQELWEKGLTSGHFQYVKSLSVDCDDDTLLAKVFQVGAACHTGHRSCFYRDLVPGRDVNNPLTVFEEVYDVIRDRKANPKEGSYTNYLFDKGMDKILKKVGEEATEIVIAAKNPDPKETVYEISDLLYHIMVLMAEKGISWKEITNELSRR